MGEVADQRSVEKSTDGSAAAAHDVEIGHHLVEEEDLQPVTVTQNVQRPVLQLFEMPLLGYAGYLPFGVECLSAAQLAAPPRDLSQS